MRSAARIHALATATLILAYGCGGSSPDIGRDASSADAGSLIDGGIADAGAAADAATDPPPPVLGTQIDRAGRPLINTLLNQSFADSAQRDAALDAWNASSDPSTWAATFTGNLTPALAMFDSFDTVCGNAFPTCNGEMPACYDAFASLLAHDWLVVKGDAAGNCAVPFAVELNEAGLANDACGGRTPAMDVVDAWYSMLIIGMNSGVGDSIAASPASTSEAFPYLAPPVN